MVFWNAPLPQPDHAERAVRCALEMQARLEPLNRAWAASGGPALAIGVGVNTGTALVGNIGAEGKKTEYTVIGDAVNLAARVETLTRKYGCGILVTEFTLQRVRPLLEGGGLGSAAAHSIGNVVVRGKQQTVRIFEIAPGDGA
jgi:adenylate cyclase